MCPEIGSVDVFESKDDITQSALGGGLQLTSGAAILQEIGLAAQLEEMGEKIKGVSAKDVTEKELDEREKKALEEYESNEAILLTEFVKSESGELVIVVSI